MKTFSTGSHSPQTARYEGQATFTQVPPHRHGTCCDRASGACRTNIPSVVQAADPLKIEIVIKDKAYKVTGHSLPGELTSILIKNEDTIEHGFTSPLLFDVPVKMEGEGVYLKGKGVRAYHIRPGKSITLTFTKGSTKDVETQRLPFWCDLHPDMKGDCSSSRPRASSVVDEPPHG